MKPYKDKDKEADGCKALACAVLEQAYRDHHRGYNLTNFMRGGKGSTLEFWCTVAGIDQDWFRSVFYKKRGKRFKSKVND